MCVGRGSSFGTTTTPTTTTTTTTSTDSWIVSEQG